jgi:hypothetical protein
MFPVSGGSDNQTNVCVDCTEVFGIGNGVASSAINTFFVRTKDCFGTPSQDGGLNFTIDFSYQGTMDIVFQTYLAGQLLDRDLSSTTVVDLQNGFYLVEYTGNNFEGEVDISVYLDAPSGAQEVFGSPFTVDFYNPTLQCPRDCNNHGACVDGACICTESYQGVDCSSGTQILISH